MDILSTISLLLGFGAFCLAGLALLTSEATSRQSRRSCRNIRKRS